MSILTTWWPLWLAWFLHGLFGWYNVWAYRKKMIAQDELNARKPEKPIRPAAVFIPIKGVRSNFIPFFDGLLNQNYPDYHVVITVETEEDATFAAVCRYLGFKNGERVLTHENCPPDGPKMAPGLRQVRLNVAGLSDNCSQKIHNQLSAIKYFEDRDRIIAFGDADILIGPDWLTRLLGPLNHETHPVSTTYRWLIPEKPTWPNLLASVINGSVGTLGGPEWCNLTWGGSYALTREAYEIVDLPESYKGALNDDLQMAHVTHHAGLRIGFVRSLMRPTPIDYSWSDMFWFAWRQYFQVRIYSPYVWAISFVATFFYSATFLITWISLFWGNPWALVPIGYMFFLNQIRATERVKVINYIFEGKDLDRLKPHFWLDRFTTAGLFFLHFIFVATTVFATKITWSGITYRVTGRQKTTVLSRSEFV